MIRHRHTNINFQSVGSRATDPAAPGEGAPLPSSSGAVVLPDPFGLYLSIIAAHDHIAPQEFLTRAIRRRLEEIGISRALDLAESVAEQSFLRSGEEASRVAHNHETAGASPASATSLSDGADTWSAVTDGRERSGEGCSGDAALPPFASGEARAPP